MPPRRFTYTHFDEASAALSRHNQEDFLHVSPFCYKPKSLIMMDRLRRPSKRLFMLINGPSNRHQPDPINLTIIETTDPINRFPDPQSLLKPTPTTKRYSQNHTLLRNFLKIKYHQDTSVKTFKVTNFLMSSKFETLAFSSNMKHVK